MRRLLTPAMRGLARRGLMRVEWCAVLTANGARLARSLSRPGGPADGDEAQGDGR